MLHSSKQRARSRLTLLGIIYLLLLITLSITTNQGEESSSWLGSYFLPVSMISSISLSWILGWYTEKELILDRYGWTSLLILLPALYLGMGGIDLPYILLSGLWGLTLWQLTQCYHNRECPDSYLFLGVGVGGAILIWPSLSSIGLIILLLSVSIDSFSLRNSLAFLYGTAIPLSATFPFVSSESVKTFIKELYIYYQRLWEQWHWGSPYHLLTTILLLYLSIGGIIIWTHYYREKTRIRNLLYFYILSSFLFLLNSLFLPPNIGQRYIILSLPTLAILLIKAGGYFSGRGYRFYLFFILLLPILMIYLTRS